MLAKGSKKKNRKWLRKGYRKLDNFKLIIERKFFVCIVFLRDSTLIVIPDTKNLIFKIKCIFEIFVMSQTSIEWIYNQKLSKQQRTRYWEQTQCLKFRWLQRYFGILYPLALNLGFIASLCSISNNSSLC